MINKKTDGITALITSRQPEMINSRFIVKASIMNNGVNTRSIMLIVQDILEDGFSIRFFNRDEDAAALLNLLKAVKQT